MSIKWLFQTSGFNTQTIHSQIKAAQHLSLPVYDFGVVADCLNITNLDNIWTDPDDLYVVRGGIKMLNILNTVKDPFQLNELLTAYQIEHFNKFVDKLKAGLFYDIKTFDQAYYNNLNLPLVNSNARIIPALDMRDMKFKTDMFIKPSRDMKAFEAGILPAGCTLQEYIRQTWSTTYAFEENIICAPVKDIDTEYRFFVVDGIISTGSIYKTNNQVQHIEIPENEKVWQVAKEYSKLYRPHNIFTMDIAKIKHTNDYQIVEYNCWNASGLYKSNITKLFGDVNSYIKSISYVPNANSPEITGSLCL